MYLTSVSASHPGTSFSDLTPHLDTVDWSKPTALAVSGGGDSMALLAAALDYRQARNLSAPFHVLTVDHALRAEAVDEAAYVASFCAARGVVHKTLTWDGATPTSAIAEKARDIRRRMLLDACYDEGITQLVLAHTLDDVAETLLMRVRRGGLRGHASIPPQTFFPNVSLLRPFLKVHREDLRSMLVAAGIRWVDDPTNENMRYERPRARQALGQLEETHYCKSNIANYADIMGRWRVVMAAQIGTLISNNCDLVGSDLSIMPKAFQNCPQLIAVETLRELVRFIGGDAHMINRDQAGIALSQLFAEEGTAKRFSVGRCVLSPRRGGRWVLSRALRDFPVAHLQPGERVSWDSRFIVTLAQSAKTAVTVFADENRPLLQPNDVPHGIKFHPLVLDGPRSCFDKPIFDAFLALLEPNDG